MTKSECRTAFLAKRKLISTAEINAFSAQIIELLTNNFDLSSKVVSLFLPIESKNEINTFLLLELKEQLNVQFALPVANFETNAMTHYLFESLEQLQKNSYDIPEPTFGKVIPENEIDVVIVPLLCVDKNGYRVGYGKGFYDRFLTQCKATCQFIGLSLFEPIDELDDASDNDVPLHFCVTPTQVHSF